MADAPFELPLPRPGGIDLQELVRDGLQLIERSDLAREEKDALRKVAEGTRSYRQIAAIYSLHPARLHRLAQRYGLLTVHRIRMEMKAGHPLRRAQRALQARDAEASRRLVTANGHS